MQQNDSIGELSVLNKKSFFINYIGKQDEISESLFITHSSDSNSINQIKLSAEHKAKKSLFVNHELQVSDFSPIVSQKNNTDFVLAAIILCVLLISISRLLSAKGLSNILKSLVSIRHLIMPGFDVFNKRISFLLFVNYIISFSLLIFFFAAFHPNLASNFEANFFIFIKIIGAVLALLLYKYIFIKLFALVFKTETQALNHGNIIYFSNQAIGVFLLPLIIITVYLNSLVFLYISSGIFVFYSVFRFARCFFLEINKSSFSVFHLFLYLCTLEILPLFIFVVLENKIGLLA